MTLNDLQGVIEIDIAGSLARFSNFEPMYLKYLKRFITEPTYDDLKAALASQDFKTIESTAHTLKGITGNLGLTALFNGFDNIVKDVRAGRNEDALQKGLALDATVTAVREALSKLD